ncbi:MAG: outer membrane lipid asymmetry maintenance protein MlaD [Rhodobacteraceae bacterium]|nr:outer membrane lipid asymmetry maintenance protein MlaD [Paracoccaceae bacterium]
MAENVEKSKKSGLRLDNPVETAIGFVVIAAAGMFAWYASQHGGGQVGSLNYPLVASFSSATGVSPGTDVRIAGVKVGAVSEVELDPKTYRANTTMLINAGVEVPEDSIAKIDSEGLLGGSFIAIAPGAAFDMLPPGDQFEHTQGAISLGNLIAQAVGASGASKDDE